MHRPNPARSMFAAIMAAVSGLTQLGQKIPKHLYRLAVQAGVCRGGKGNHIGGAFGNRRPHTYQRKFARRAGRAQERGEDRIAIAKAKDTPEHRVTFMNATKQILLSAPAANQPGAGAP